MNERQDPITGEVFWTASRSRATWVVSISLLELWFLEGAFADFVRSSMMVLAPYLFIMSPYAVFYRHDYYSRGVSGWNAPVQLIERLGWVLLLVSFFYIQFDSGSRILRYL